MEAIELLKEEHEKVAQYLLDLEAVMNTSPLNFPAVVHLMKEGSVFWDMHESKEEDIFALLNEGGYKIPIHAIYFEHGELKKHREAIQKAINSGSEAKLKESLENHGRKLIERMRKHVNYEDQYIYALPEEQLEKRVLIKLENYMKFLNRAR